MFLKRVFASAKNYIIKNRSLPFKLRTNFKVSQLDSKFIKTSAIVFFLTSTIAKCIDQIAEFQPEIHQITKQQLVQYIHKDHSQEFVVIVYDRFKRLNQKQFGEELKPIIEECKNAKIGKVYLIDSKEKDHLNQIIRILKNIPHDSGEQQEEDAVQSKNEKKKVFQCFFKSKYFNQAIELERNNGESISKQISQIRHFEVNSNSQKINQVLADYMSNPFLVNQTYVVKQCISDGECAESYKREIKRLIDGGMLNGKKDQFKFQLIIDQPTGILSSSSEYVKNFIKNTQKLKGKTINPNRKEEIYVFKKDLFGSQISLYSEWLQKEGFNYSSSSDKFLMFIKPRINLISKINTLPDLMWFLRTAKLNNQVSISLNNVLKFGKENKKETIQVLKLVYQHFPKINYLIVSSQKVRELLRHINADYKYVIFKQDSNIIWNKQFLNLDILETLPSKQQKQKLFVNEFKSKISSFIDNPALNSLVQVEKQLQINIQKLKNLKDQQLRKISLKKYVIRVCKQHCHRYLDNQVIDQINSKLEEPINVYWIDSSAQNIGVQDGNYILKDGNLQSQQQFLRS